MAKGAEKRCNSCVGRREHVRENKQGAMTVSRDEDTQRAVTVSRTITARDGFTLVWGRSGHRALRGWQQHRVQHVMHRRRYAMRPADAHHGACLRFELRWPFRHEIALQ